MTLGILFFSEILPKNIGVLYRPKLLPVMVYPLFGIYRLAGPLTNFSSWLIRRILRKPPETNFEGEIEMLAEREAREGRMNAAQLRMIRSALDLDEATVEDAMTPRNVVLTCEADETAVEFFTRIKKVPFARIPVVGTSPDDILGVLRRKDLMQTLVTGRGEATVRSLMRAPVIVPEIGKLASALEMMLAEHQQLAVVVDEFGGFAGVVTLEDIFEFLIGREFYEADDVAVDMRELARRRSRHRRNPSRREEESKQEPNQ
jgi:CBS domain containing-hemolysin-like protein